MQLTNMAADLAESMTAMAGMTLAMAPECAVERELIAFVRES